jgi:hypothetical protein
VRRSRPGRRCWQSSGGLKPKEQKKRRAGKAPGAWLTAWNRFGVTKRAHRPQEAPTPPRSFSSRLQSKGMQIGIPPTFARSPGLRSARSARTRTVGKTLPPWSSAGKPPGMPRTLAKSSAAVRQKRSAARRGRIARRAARSASFAREGVGTWHQRVREATEHLHHARSNVRIEILQKLFLLVGLDRL